MIVAVYVELDGKNGSATQSRSRRRTSQAETGALIRRAAGPDKTGTATRAILGASLPIARKAKRPVPAAQSGPDSVLAGRPCGPRWGTRRDDVALSCARRNGPGGFLEAQSGVSPRPSRTGRRAPRQGSGAGRVGRGHLDAGRAGGDGRNFRAAAGHLSFLLPPASAAGDGGAGDRY